MHEKSSCLLNQQKSEECECLLTKTSSTKHERAVNIWRDWRNVYLLITQGLISLHLKVCHLTQEWLKKVDALIGEYDRSCTSSVTNFFEKHHHSQPNTPERETLLCGSWLTARVLFYQLQGPLFRNFLHVVPKLPGGFNPREVVLYRQMELIRTETVERMNELLECCWLCGHYKWFMDSQPSTLSLCCCGSQDKQWLQEPLSPSFATWKTGPHWKKWWLCCERVFESVALPGKRIAVATANNGINMIKVNERWRNRRWPCAAVHMLYRVIKSTMKRVNNNSSVDLLPRVLRVVWSSTSTSKGNGRKRNQEDQWLPRYKVWGFICMC